MQVSWWVGLLTTFLLVVRGQPDGWRMVDRFYGFRYELSGRNLDTASIIESILNEADNYACFGWVQVSPAGSIVGEARCAKARGKILQEKLKNISPQISKTDFLVCIFVISHPPIPHFCNSLLVFIIVWMFGICLSLLSIGVRRYQDPIAFLLV